MTDVGGFEAALARIEADLTNTLKAEAALTRELKRARAAAANGNVRDLRRGLRAAVELAAETHERARVACVEYDVDEADLLASGSYAKELLAAASERGLSIFEEDERLLCYPSIVRVLAADLALEVDHKKARNLRPSVVVEQLARAQQAGPRFRPEPFLVSLLSAYDFVVAKQGKDAGAVVRVVDIYGALTLLPGQSREYTKQEFARDLYLLDQTHVNVAGSPGRRLRWAASSGTRQTGVLSTVAKSGQQQRYWGIAFDPASPR